MHFSETVCRMIGKEYEAATAGASVVADAAAAAAAAAAVAARCFALNLETCLPERRSDAESLAWTLPALTAKWTG